MKVSLIGYSCNRSGLAELNRQVATYCTFIDKWLIWSHPRLGVKIEEGIQPHIETRIAKGKISPANSDWLLKTDILLFFETPFDNPLVAKAKQLGKTVICIPMLEWTTPKSQSHTDWTKYVDLFICPTKQCYDALNREGYPCQLFQWPHDTERFQFIQRETCKRFLFIEGGGGYKGRKGGEAIKEALDIWPQMPLTIITQKSRSEWVGPPNLKVIPSDQANLEMYRQGDILLYPATCDGIGLQPFEARSSGMPVIQNDARPWNENFYLASVASEWKHQEVKSGRFMEWHKTDPTSLVEVCKGLLNTSIKFTSGLSRQKAEENSWSNKIGTFNNLLMEAKV